MKEDRRWYIIRPDKSVIAVIDREDCDALKKRRMIKARRGFAFDPVVSESEIKFFLKSRRGGSKTTVPLKSNTRDSHMHKALVHLFIEES